MEARSTSGWTSQVRRNYKELDGFIEISACVLEIFTDELFVSVLRPTDRLNAPGEAPQRLPGMKPVCFHRLGTRNLINKTG